MKLPDASAPPSYCSTTIKGGIFHRWLGEQKNAILAWGFPNRGFHTTAPQTVLTSGCLRKPADDVT